MVLASELAAVQQEIRAVRKRLKRAVVAAKDGWTSLPAIVVRQAMLVYLWALNSLPLLALPAAAAYLRQQGVVANDEGEDLETFFTCMFVAAPLTLLTELATAPQRHELRSACKFIVQYNLYDYIRRSNLSGIAPGRHALIAEALASLPLRLPTAVQEHVRRPLVGGASVQRRFLRKFRANWGAVIGNLKLLPDIPLHLMQEKAPNFEFAFHHQFWGVFCNRPRILSLLSTSSFGGSFVTR